MTDAFDYLESRDDADEMIQEFGRAVAVRKLVNTGEPDAPTQTATDYATFGVTIAFTWKQIQGGNILDTDQRWLVAAGPLDALGVSSMTPPDMIVVDDVELEIVKADPLRPAGIVVMFDCQVRA